MSLRRTKILVTLGPSTSSIDQIRNILRAGADAIRLNFSHGTFREHLESISRVRQISRELKRPVAILADIPGPKLRVGHLVNGSVNLRPGATCVLTTRDTQGNAGLIPVLFPDLPRVVRKGGTILLADGQLELRVLRRAQQEVTCRVVIGGELAEHKGINLPGVRLKIPILTPRDRQAIRTAFQGRVDYIALSFVRNASDMVKARRWILRDFRRDIPLIAKIERPEALAEIRGILEASDGIMIARGDLGVEVPPERVPVVQKELIHLSTEMGVPVITATQMLGSMVENIRPTRAEASDVANAIWDGTDAVMLSNETAAGRYPLQAVRTMVRIIEEAERHPAFQWSPPLAVRTKSPPILRAAADASMQGDERALVAYTKSGATAVALSKLRPPLPIFALTPDQATYSRLSLVWGVTPLVAGQGKSVGQMIRIGDHVLMRQARLRRKDRIILIAGTRLVSGATNIMKIHPIGESLT